MFSPRFRNCTSKSEYDTKWSVPNLKFYLSNGEVIRDIIFIKEVAYSPDLSQSLASWHSAVVIGWALNVCFSPLDMKVGTAVNSDLRP